MDAFLETTAMIDLLFKESARRDIVKEAIKEYQSLYSSQYVRMEIKRGFLQNLVALYNKSKECSTFTEVLAYVSTLSSTPRKNMLGTMLEAIARFYDPVTRKALAEGASSKDFTKVQKKMAEAYLRSQINRFWSGFSRLVDVVLDEAECYKNGYSIQPPFMTPEGKFDNTLESCDKYKPGICKVRQLFDQNESETKNIIVKLAEIESPDTETQNRLRALKEIVRLKKRDVQKRECWRSGDAVIAIEAPENVAIVTRNCKHFTPICAALGKPLRCY